MGISNTLVVIAIIAAIIISVAGTYIIIEKADNVKIIGNAPNYGTVGVNVVPRGQIAVNVVNPSETNS